MISATIQSAAELFGVPPCDLYGNRRSKAINAARRWIVSQLPDVGSLELSKALGITQNALCYIRRQVENPVGDPDGDPWVMDVEAYFEIRRQKQKAARERAIYVYEESECEY